MSGKTPKKGAEPNGVLSEKRVVEAKRLWRSHTHQRLGNFTINPAYTAEQWERFRTKAPLKTAANISNAIVTVLEMIGSGIFDPKWVAEEKDDFLSRVRAFDQDTPCRELSAALKTLFDAIDYIHVDQIKDFNNLLDQLPTSEMKNRTYDFWYKEIMDDMQNANNPAKFLTVVNKVLRQVTPGSPIIVKEWAKREKSWLKDCQEASTWERVAELTDKIAQEDSIFFDWDKCNKIFKDKPQPVLDTMSPPAPNSSKKGTSSASKQATPAVKSGSKGQSGKSNARKQDASRRSAQTSEDPEDDVDVYTARYREAKGKATAGTVGASANGNGAESASEKKTTAETSKSRAKDKTGKPSAEETSETSLPDSDAPGETLVYEGGGETLPYEETAYDESTETSAGAYNSEKQGQKRAGEEAGDEAGVASGRQSRKRNKPDFFVVKEATGPGKASAPSPTSNKRSREAESDAEEAESTGRRGKASRGDENAQDHGSRDGDAAEADRADDAAPSEGINESAPDPSPRNDEGAPAAATALDPANGADLAAGGVEQAQVATGDAHVAEASKTKGKGRAPEVPGGMPPRKAGRPSKADIAAREAARLGASPSEIPPPPPSAAAGDARAPRPTMGSADLEASLASASANGAFVPSQKKAARGSSLFPPGSRAGIVFPQLHDVIAEVSETWTPGKFRTGHVIVAEQLLKESLERYLAEHRGEYEATCRYIQERTTTNVEEEMQARVDELEARQAALDQLRGNEDALHRKQAAAAVQEAEKACKRAGDSRLKLLEALAMKQEYDQIMQRKDDLDDLHQHSSLL